MMMPANYSVIAENEMTYVNGGASFIDAIGAVTAPIWNLDNVKAFSTNIVTLIGNNFVTSTIQNTLGYVFGGNATKADLGTMFGKVVGEQEVFLRTESVLWQQITVISLAVWELPRWKFIWHHRKQQQHVQ